MSLYESIKNCISMLDNIDSISAILSSLYSQIKPILTKEKVYFREHDIQLLKVSEWQGLIEIEIYLQTITVVIGISQDNVKISITPLIISNCVCGEGW